MEIDPPQDKCIICDKEFNKRYPNQKCCSKECEVSFRIKKCNERWLVRKPKSKKDLRNNSFRHF